VRPHWFRHASKKKFIVSTAVLQVPAAYNGYAQYDPAAYAAYYQQYNAYYGAYGTAPPQAPPQPQQQQWPAYAAPQQSAGYSRFGSLSFL